MKNAKFNVISMSCGDVIATSCASAAGVAAIQDGVYMYGTLNGEKEIPESLLNKIETNSAGKATGMYHFDSEGNIYEECPYAKTDMSKFYELHDLGN